MARRAHETSLPPPFLKRVWLPERDAPPDEPESALSPARQFDFLKILRRMQREGKSQVIMATHSPILMALPDADLWQIEKWGIRPTTLEETSHFKIYREFILYPHDTVEAMIE